MTGSPTLSVPHNTYCFLSCCLGVSNGLVLAWHCIACKFQCQMHHGWHCWKLLVLVVGQGGMWVVGGLRPAAGQIPEWGGWCEMGSNCERTVETKGVISLQLTAVWHHEGGKFGHKPQGCAWAGVKVCTKIWLFRQSHGKYASCPAAWWNRQSYSMHAFGVYCLKSIAMRVWYFTRDNAMSGSYAILAEVYQFHASRQVCWSMMERLLWLDSPFCCRLPGTNGGGPWGAVVMWSDILTLFKVAI